MKKKDVRDFLRVLNCLTSDQKVILKNQILELKKTQPKITQQEFINLVRNFNNQPRSEV